MADAATRLETAPKRKPANRNLGPKPAYVLVNLPDGVALADIRVVGLTLKAEEALEAIDTKTATNYIRVMIPAPSKRAPVKV